MTKNEMYNKNNYSKRVYIFRYPFLEQPENRKEAKKEQKIKESLLLFVVLIRTRFNSQFIFTWHPKKVNIRLYHTHRRPPKTSLSFSLLGGETRKLACYR